MLSNKLSLSPIILVFNNIDILSLSWKTQFFNQKTWFSVKLSLLIKKQGFQKWITEFSDNLSFIDVKLCFLNKLSLLNEKLSLSKTFPYTQ